MSQAAHRTSSEAGQVVDRDRRIPIYFRLIQKDIWLRMHVDTRSTIGAIKDAFLERIEMAPHDPSFHVNFYDDARWAMARQNASQQEARYLPKAFVARAPKRSIKELLKVESDLDAASLFTSTSAKSAARRTPSAKSVSVSGQARAILGNDAGVGGRGTLGFVCANLTLDDEASINVDSSLPTVSHQTPITPSMSSSRRQQRPDRTSAPSGFAINAHTAALSDSGAADSIIGTPSSSSYDSRHTRQRTHHADDLLIASGLVDAEALKRLGGRLPGNEDAMRLEREAMYSFRAAESLKKDSLPKGAVVKGFDFVDGQIKVPNGSLDGQNGVKEEGTQLDSARQSIRSSISSVAEERRTDDANAINGAEAILDSSPATSEKGARATSPYMTTGERARSGTIVPSEAQRRAAMNASILLQQGSSTPSTINTMSSTDMQVAEADLSKLPAAHMAIACDSQPPPGSVNAEMQVGSIANNAPAAKRLAGIHTDEISSWRDAQHGQARHFAIHSFSNGHVLEDWRTVASVRLRPYELLEVQNVDIRDKVHLPRSGEAMNVCTRKGLPKVDKDDIATSFGPAVSSTNPALHADYLEPYAECWAYIFKRGSGTSRTQRAGLGLWKLRWICLHSNRIFVFRSKPPRFAFDEAIMVWNLDCVDTVFAERADGATRPHLPILAGQCQDILSLTFRASLGDDNVEYSQYCVSMRFVTQLDHSAFFRSCSRAHFRAVLRRKDPHNASTVFEWRRRALARATIAGMGGTVMPGKAARRGGRNSLSRTRLRPPGIKRDFDDADRWSSESETEEFVPRFATSESSSQTSFRYADAILASLSLNVEASGLPYSPPAAVVPVSSYFRIGSPDTGTSSRATIASPVTPSFATQKRASSRHRGFTSSNPTTSNVTPMAVGVSEQMSSNDASPAQARLQHAMSMRSLSSQGAIGLGVLAGALNGITAKSDAVDRSTPSLTISPEKGGEQSPDKSATEESVVALPSIVSQTTSIQLQRPIVSPELESELEHSPAAQAIHSFLAQRSSSRASNLSRSRSATIATTHTTSNTQHKSAVDDEFFSSGPAESERRQLFSFDRQRQTLSQRPAAGQSPSIAFPSSPSIRTKQ